MRDDVGPGHSVVEVLVVHFLQTISTCKYKSITLLQFGEQGDVDPGDRLIEWSIEGMPAVKAAANFADLAEMSSSSLWNHHHYHHQDIIIIIIKFIVAKF